MAAKKVDRIKKLKRDTLILAWAVGIATVEILFFGGRTSVLTFAGAIFVSPAIIRVDERNKE